MKKSNKILLIAFGVVFVVIAVSIITIRLYFSKADSLTPRQVIVEMEGLNVNTIAEPPIKQPSKQQIQPFDEIKIEGAWQVRVKQGDKYRLQIIAAPEIKQFIDVKNKNGQLYLRKVNYSGRAQCLAEITTPKLNSIHLSGASDIVFDGFQSEKFAIVASGASYVYGKNSIFEKLRLKSFGASKVDLLNAKVKSADVKASGASTIKLNMMGGVLTGALSGVSKIRYTGSVSKTELGVSGMSSVKSLN